MVPAGRLYVLYIARVHTCRRLRMRDSQTLYSGEKTQPETCEGPSSRAVACAMAGWLGEDGGQEMKAGDIALVGPHTCYWVGS